MRNIAKLAIAASLAALATPASASFLVTYEAAGATNSTAGFDYFGIETFDGRGSGQTSFSETYSHDGKHIKLSYTDVTIIPADAYGGAGGSDYAVVGLFSETRSYTIDITASPVSGINYFGYWLSALDEYNYVSFWNGSNKVFEFDPTDVKALLLGKPEYLGHPVTGENENEPYVFLNFFYQTGTFNRVVFHQAGDTGAGYESDNHTVGFYTTTSGTPITQVPEPAALGLIGAGLLGIAALHRRRRV